MNRFDYDIRRAEDTLSGWVIARPLDPPFIAAHLAETL
jgi:hypothetical protein